MNHPAFRMLTGAFLALVLALPARAAVPEVAPAEPEVAPAEPEVAPAEPEVARAEEDSPAWTEAAPRPEADVQILENDETRVALEYRPGPGTPAEQKDFRGEARFLRFDGTRYDPAPGYPAVPFLTRTLIVPAGSTYHVEFSVDGQESLPGLRFPSADPPRVRVDALKEAAPMSLSELPAPRDQWIPESPVTWSEGDFRGQRLLVIKLSPVQFNPADGTTLRFERISVRVSFTPETGTKIGREPLAPAAGDPILKSMLASFVLNPDARLAPARSAVPALSPRSATGAPGIPDVYFDDAAQWIKMRIRENGFYRVTGDDLGRLGINIAAIDPATLRLFSGFGLPLSETTPESNAAGWGDRWGFREIAVTVRDNGVAGQLEAGDDIIFYGLGPDNYMSTYDASLPQEWFENESSDATVIWLTWGGGFPAAPLRIPSQDATPVPGDSLVDVVQDKLHLEKNDPTQFDPVPWEQGIRWEKWWWQELQGSGVSNFWDLQLPDADVTRPAALFIRWWGANWPLPDATADPERSHFLNVTVNGTPVNAQWTGGIRRFDMSVTDFEVKPTIRVTGRVPRVGTNPDRVDLVLLAWFEMTYWKSLTLTRNLLWFEDRSVTAGPVRFRITGAAADAAVYDVTDPGRPVRLVGSLSGQELSFRVADSGAHHFMALNGVALKSPAPLQVDAHPSRWLRDASQGVDYLVITWDEFDVAAQEQAQWRISHLKGITETRPARTAVVKVTDIYDEFSGGMIDPTAIRNFIQYVYSNWGAGQELPPLSYVSLIGDANRDARDREQTGVRNLIPTWQGGQDYIDYTNIGGVDQYSTDDFFGRLQGPNDIYTDIIIGRLPVYAESQARQVVEQKIIRSEQFPGFNPDRDGAILVADDVCQLGSSDDLQIRHIAQSEDLARVIPRDIDIRRIYLYDYGGNDCSIFYKPVAKKDLIAALNEGTAIFNYIGHGSDQQIADEKILEVPDVTTLNNLDKLSNFIAASCSVGKFDRPNTEGLAEVLIKSPTGGCLATMAATHLSDAFDNADLNKAIITHLYPSGDVRSIPVGKALLEAKLSTISPTCAANPGFACDRQRKYLLLGDPASILITPQREIRMVGVPDTLRRGSLVTFTGEVLDADGQVDASFQGQVNLRVEDQPGLKYAYPSGQTTGGFPYKAGGATIFEGVSPVSSGQFSASFVVPVSLRGGPAGRIRAYAASPERDAAGAEIVTVGGLATGAPDSLPPEIVLTLPAGVASPGEEVEVVIQDASGINLTQLFEFRSVQFAILDDQEMERFRADLTSGFSYDPGSYTTGRVRATLPELPSGHYTLRVTATDNYNNRGEGLLEIDLVTRGSDRAVSEVYGLPNPFADQTEITWALAASGPVKLSIYSVSGRKVREWSIDGTRGENRVSWDGTDQKGDAVANGVYLVRVAVKGGGGDKDVVEPLVRVR